MERLAAMMKAMLHLGWCEHSMVEVQCADGIERELLFLKFG